MHRRADVELAGTFHGGGFESGRVGEQASNFLPDRPQHSGQCFGRKAEHCRPFARERTCGPHPQQNRNEPNWFANRPEATSFYATGDP